MEDKILKLKKLNAAYIAALEYDYCPEPDKTNDVMVLFETGVSEQDLKDSLIENQGSRPDQIADEISEIIKSL
jgi:hypothetical protein